MINNNKPIPLYLVVVASEPFNTHILSYDKGDLAGLLSTIKIELMSIYQIDQKNILDENLKNDLRSIIIERNKMNYPFDINQKTREQLEKIDEQRLQKTLTEMGL